IDALRPRVRTAMTGWFAPSALLHATTQAAQNASSTISRWEQALPLIELHRCPLLTRPSSHSDHSDPKAGLTSASGIDRWWVRYTASSRPVVTFVEVVR